MNRMPIREIAYLGPPGTYSHLVCEKRYGRKIKLVPLPTILDVFLSVSGRHFRRGVVPVESSSGGSIYETVDILIGNKPRVHVEEEFSLEVKIALLGSKGEKITTLYSHFAPLEHCAVWLKRHFPKVERKTVASTAIAAQYAAREKHAAALGGRRLAALYGLDVLHYPIQPDVPNITSFIAIRADNVPAPRVGKTSISAVTQNRPGALCTFLEAFRDKNANLCRIVSRPLRGRPSEYAFLVDIEGGLVLPSIRSALQAARKTCTHLRVVGSYPCSRSYRS